MNSNGVEKNASFKHDSAMSHTVHKICSNRFVKLSILMEYDFAFQIPNTLTSGE